MHSKFLWFESNAVHKCFQLNVTLHNINSDDNFIHGCFKRSEIGKHNLIILINVILPVIYLFRYNFKSLQNKIACAKSLRITENWQLAIRFLVPIRIDYENRKRNWRNHKNIVTMLTPIILEKVFTQFLH